MLDLNLIRSFVVFSSARNIHEAARTLGCSQSTVTLHLQRLESEMGFTLFEVQGKKKLLTLEGRKLLDSLEPKLSGLLGSVQRIRDRAADARNQKLRIGGRREILARLARDIRFDGTLALEFLREAEAQQKFLGHDLDLIVVHERDLFSPQVYIKKLFSSGSKLHVHRSLIGGARASNFALSRDFLTSVPALVYSTQDFRLLSICRQLEINPLEIQMSGVAEDWNVLLGWVNEGRGYCIAPDTYKPLSSEVLSLDISPALIPLRAFYLAYRKPVRDLLRRGDLVFLDPKRTK